MGSSASAINNQPLDRRPDLVNLKSQAMSQEHRKQASLGHTEALVQANYIRLNLNGLNIIKGDGGKFYSADNTQMSGHQISMKLPNINKPVLLNVESVQNLIKGEDVVTYTGYVANRKNDFFTLSVSDDGVMAKINYGKYIYIITPLHGQSSQERLPKHSIAQLEKRLMVKDTSDDVVLADEKSTQSKNYVEKSSGGSGHVSVLFYFAGDVWYQSLYTSTIVSEMNAALSRSGVSSNNYISSAGIKVVNSTFSGQCKNDILTKMKDSTSEFSNINQDLLAYGADIAVLLVKTYTNQDCGFASAGIWGRVGGVAVPYNQGSPFAVFADAYALGDLTALHEIGHIFGGAHAYPFNYSGEYSYSKGLVHYNHQNPNDSWQTIMGSYGYSWVDNCVFNGPYSPCERLDYFSNPNLSYNGIALGANNRNMKRSLNNTMPIVSGWRGAPVPPPSAPNPISSNSEFCFGMNTINWTAQYGVTEYKLYKSSSSSFTSPTLLYSGGNTVTMVNVNSGTWYLRAQACNTSGCSSYSNQVTASRYNGCL